MQKETTDFNPRELPPQNFHYPSFKKGAWDILPVLVGVIPFAVITGVLVSGVGLSLGNGLVMSITLYAGASQVAALDLMSRHAPVGVIIFTALIINMRFIMYSAATGPYLRGISTPRKLICSYILSDQSFAITALDSNDPHSRLHRYSYFLGSSLCLFTVWNLALPVGMLLGKGIPTSWQLDFAIPLTFLSLLIPALRERTHVCAALVSGSIAVLGNSLPGGMALLAGGICGILTGFGLEKLKISRDNARANQSSKNGANR